MDRGDAHRSDAREQLSREDDARDQQSRGDGGLASGRLASRVHELERRRAQVQPAPVAVPAPAPDEDDDGLPEGGEYDRAVAREIDSGLARWRDDEVTDEDVYPDEPEPGYREPEFGRHEDEVDEPDDGDESFDGGAYRTEEGPAGDDLDEDRDDAGERNGEGDGDDDAHDDAHEPATGGERLAARAHDYPDLDRYAPLEIDGAPRPAARYDDFEADAAPYAATFEEEEVRRPRNRPLLLVGALAGVAVIAGGLIVGYQMLAGGDDGRVPIVSLEATPAKVAPDDPGGLTIPHQNKLIYDRIVGEETPVEEKIVPRQEEVIDLNRVGDGEPGGDDGVDIASAPGAAVPPPIAPGGGEDAAAAPSPGRSEALAILQGNSGGYAGAGSALRTEPAGVTPDAVPTTPRVATAPGGLGQIPGGTFGSAAGGGAQTVETVAPPEPAGTAMPAPPLPRIKPEPPVRPAESIADTGPGSGPVRIASLPDVTTAPPPPTQPSFFDSSQATPSAVAPATPLREASAGDYVVQIAAFRSESEAQAEFSRLRNRHGGLLSGYSPLIQRADLGSRGIYYRLRLGPIASKQNASQLCNSLLAAGETDCLVRRQ